MKSEREKSEQYSGSIAGQEQNLNRFYEHQYLQEKFDYWQSSQEMDFKTRSASGICWAGYFN